LSLLRCHINNNLLNRDGFRLIQSYFSQKVGQYFPRLCVPGLCDLSRVDKKVLLFVGLEVAVVRVEPHTLMTTQLFHTLGNHIAILNVRVEAARLFRKQ